jgi:hypothetical protein
VGSKLFGRQIEVFDSVDTIGMRGMTQSFFKSGSGITRHKGLMVQFGCGQYNLAFKKKPFKMDESINVLFEQIWIFSVGIDARTKNNIEKAIEKHFCILS